MGRKPDSPSSQNRGCGCPGFHSLQSRQIPFLFFVCSGYISRAGKGDEEARGCLGQDKYILLHLPTCHAMHTEDDREPADCPLDRHILKLQTQVKLKDRGTGCVHILFV